MVETTFEITTADGSMESFGVRPDGAGEFPAVILYMDAPGIRDELRDFCRRIAAEGYYALLPDMYYRLGRIRFDRTSLNEGGREKMFAAMRSLDNAQVMSDTAAMLEFLRGESCVGGGGVGCIGYCMSGQYVVSAAGSYPEQFAAAASLYGVGIVTRQPDSPHLLAERIRGELYLGFAELDEYVPDHVIPELRAQLEKHGVEHRIETFPGTQHGFCFPERDGIYVEPAAERVWERVFELYERRLR
jgi:carboxymethylenebutenolidase